MESAREARRRKILERGSDRLAFITGQSRSPTPSASFSSPLAPALEPQQHQEKENPRSTTTGTTSSPECTVGGRDLSVLEKTSIVLEGTRILSKESVCEHASIYDLHHGDAAGVEAHKHQPIDQTFNTEESLPEDDADREFSSYETSSEFAKCKMGKRFQGGKRKEATAYAEQDGLDIQANQSCHLSF